MVAAMFNCFEAFDRAYAVVRKANPRLPCIDRDLISAIENHEGAPEWW